MCNSAIICLAIVAAVASISQVSAQAQTTPQSCAQATGISFNQTAVSERPVMYCYSHKKTCI